MSVSSLIRTVVSSSVRFKVHDLADGPASGHLSYWFLWRPRQDSNLRPTVRKLERARKYVREFRYLGGSFDELSEHARVVSGSGDSSQPRPRARCARRFAEGLVEFGQRSGRLCSAAHSCGVKRTSVALPRAEADELVAPPQIVEPGEDDGHLVWIGLRVEQKAKVRFEPIEAAGGRIEDLAVDL